MFLTNVAYASAAGHHAGPLFQIGPVEITSEITTMWGVMILILLLNKQTLFVQEICQEPMGNHQLYS